MFAEKDIVSMPPGMALTSKVGSGTHRSPFTARIVAGFVTLLFLSVNAEEHILSENWTPQPCISKSVRGKQLGRKAYKISFLRCMRGCASIVPDRVHYTVA